MKIQALRRWLGAACIASALLGCASPEKLIAQGGSEESIEAAVVTGGPIDRLIARQRLANAYYSQAQRALAAGDEANATRWFQGARTQALRILESSPTDAFSHNMLALVAIYRRDLPGALQSLRIAREYNPRAADIVLNLAELEVYGGEVDQARLDLDACRKLQASPAAIALVESLVLWREANLPAAREQFEKAVGLDRKLVRTWNGATATETFADFTSHCCERSGFCQTYMSNVCARGADATTP